MATRTRKAVAGNGQDSTVTQEKIENLEPLPKAPATAGLDQLAPIMSIERIPTKTIEVPIVGTSPLIMHNWSAKARRIMLETQQGKKAQKEIRDPEADYQAAFYRIAVEDGKAPKYGMPVISFKQATVSAARFFGKAVTMTTLRQCLFFRGVSTAADRQELTEILFTTDPTMREDMVRVGNSGTDLRYRPEFSQWSAVLRVTYVASLIDQQSVLSLVDGGGMGVGVGDWRPEKKGTFGCYTLDESKPVTEVQFR
jgi:hypothetical protein